MSFEPARTRTIFLSQTRPGEGFLENKIAELFSLRKLGKSVEYTFYPDATGFIRNTLNVHRCDVVLGIAQGDDDRSADQPWLLPNGLRLRRIARMVR